MLMFVACVIYEFLLTVCQYLSVLTVKVRTAAKEPLLDVYTFKINDKNVLVFPAVQKTTRAEMSVCFGVSWSNKDLF